MAIMVSDNSKAFIPAPEGIHQAVCCDVIDHGICETKFGTKPRVELRWVINEVNDDGRLFMVTKRYTASLNEKANLRKDLQNWRGREFTPEELAGFDPKNVLGKACLLSITLSDKGKARVTGVSGIPKGMDVPKQVNPSVYFSLDDFDRHLYEALPKFYKELIAKSPEYQKVVGTMSDLKDDPPWDDTGAAGPDVPF